MGRGVLPGGNGHRTKGNKGNEVGLTGAKPINKQNNGANKGDKSCCSDDGCLLF